MNRKSAGQYKRGMSLLIAILLTGSALLVAVGISSLILGQINLSQSSRESHAALFAAQTGIECGLYYNNRYIPAVPGYSLWDTLTNPCDYLNEGPGADPVVTVSAPSGPPQGVTCRIQCLGLLSQASDPGASLDYVSRVTGTRSTYTPPTPDPNDTEINEYQFDFTLRKVPVSFAPPIWNRSPGICTDVTIVVRNTKEGGRNFDQIKITSEGKSSCSTNAPRVNRTLEFEEVRERI